MSLWESLAARYARPLDEDDEIDILTGKIYKDRGVLRAAADKGWRIGSFGGAIEVEPVGASEGETEAGTSEGDDEGEGDGLGDTEEGEEEEEEDPFETWSYDWQYRELPPPRPELSPKDAEDLEEFLAAERAIQESVRNNGGKPELEEDEDEVVYMGDSLHKQDGALRDDDNSDDEFASFMVDDSTIRLAKREEDDEDEDEVAPMSSILGALAIGKGFKGRLLDSARTDTAAKAVVSSFNSPRANINTSVPSTLRACAGSSTSVHPGSEAGVEDELIVIDSDTDDELDVDINSPSKPWPAPNTLPPISAISSSKPASSSQKPLKGSLSVARANSASAIIAHETSALAAQPVPSASALPCKKDQSNRTSFSAMAASLQASAKCSTSNPNSPALPPLDPSSSSRPPPSKAATKPIAKRMLSRTSAKAKEASPKAGTSISGSLFSSAAPKTPTSTSTIKAITSSSTLANASSKTLNRTPSSTNKVSTRPTPAVSQNIVAKTHSTPSNKTQQPPVRSSMKPKSAAVEATKGKAKSLSSGATENEIAVRLSKPSVVPSVSTVGTTSKTTLTSSTAVASPSTYTRPESPIKYVFFYFTLSRSSCLLLNIGLERNLSSWRSF
jgi:hypothetical protein